MAPQEVLYEVKDYIATITLNRPDVLNALGRRLCEDLIEIAHDIKHNRQVRVAIITGAGRAFCAGANLKERKALEGEAKWQLVHTINAAMGAVYEMEIPVIAAVNGHALGGGTELAASCDIIFAAEEATFGCTEVTLGIIPGGGIVRLSRLIGMGHLSELVLTGKRLSAWEAEKMGLVNKVVPAAALMGEAYQLAEVLRDNAPLAVKAAKKLIRLCMESPLEVCHELSELLRRPLDYTRDMQEGLAAFAERRKPQYIGE